MIPVLAAAAIAVAAVFAWLRLRRQQTLDREQAKLRGVEPHLCDVYVVV